MVDPLVLSTDLVETVVFLATPPLLWLFLFLFAFVTPGAAESAGFGPRAFWLLLPGALVGEIASAPFFAWGGNVLAVDVGGGLIPVLLSLSLMHRRFGDGPRLFAVFLGAYTVECGTMLMAVFALPDGAGLDLVVVVLGSVVALAMFSLPTRPTEAARRTWRNASFLLALTTLALVPTFLSTMTVPGLGIESAFPFYLLPPIAVGALAVPVGRRLGLPRLAPLGLAYAAQTFGVLIGADLLRQPPLYGGSISALYAIGGAGAGDLLYLSPLIAISTAFLTVALVGRFAGERQSVGEPSSSGDHPQPASAPYLLRRALREAVDGAIAASVRDSAAAVEVAASQAAQLRPAAPPTPSAGWGAISAPLWVQADRANLAALAHAPSLQPLDATRAFLTARWLVRFFRQAGRSAFASIPARTAAFLVDLSILSVPTAVALWWFAVGFPGTSDELLTSVPFNAIVLALPSAALVYFTLAEALWGSSVGKAVLGLEVVRKDRARPGPLTAFLRNLPKLVTFTVVALILALWVAVFLGGAGFTFSTVGGVVLSTSAILVLIGVLLVGIGLPGAVSAIAIEFTPEAQRLGDLWAGTWVLQRRAGPPAAPLPRPG